MRTILLLGALVGVSASITYFLDIDRDEPQTAPAQIVAPTPAQPVVATAPSGRKVAIPADKAGHFRTELRFNGRKVEGLIDTGATLIAMNATTARKVGVAVPRTAFKHEIDTANGKTKAALVRLDTVEIGRIRVSDIDAVVLEDEALSGILVGMSLLRQLARFEVKDGTLLLEQ
ncbi:TIGR02281 family clan AA aspartic protease [Mesorhizobium sp. J428]|uniref:TIGR02281 family clan AA aspartic protease n=1 Tax=Mesorhizobium sp. J428 TaxID=2898440 RepID=UPI002150B206|nr:TIGR02281 family clan AA aspartic protease [Mesorhizobium sp. J428]MCR5857762.1 TIGR02281 family clan AA aspartic protease [Mesorhizobium sp. J428]